MSKVFKRLFVASVVTGLFYFLFGFFVIEPIGMLKDGSTVLYFRPGLDSKFITSAEAILSDGDVTGVEKLFVLGKFTKKVNDRKVASFPYSGTLHHFATTGRLFE